MLHHGVVMRWVPRYFGRRAQPFWRSGRSASKVVEATSLPSTAVASSERAVKPCKVSSGELAANLSADGHSRGVAAAAVMGKRQLDATKKIVSYLLCPPTVAAGSQGQALMQKAEMLLSCLRELDDTLLERRIGCGGSYSPQASPLDEAYGVHSRKQRRDAVLITVRTEVFGVLKGILPPVERHADDPPQSGTQSIEVTLQEQVGAADATEPSKGSLVVIPDEATDDVARYLHKMDRHFAARGNGGGGGGGGASSSAGSTPLMPPVFTLREVVVFLQLYHAIDCEDGCFLLQLLQEVRQIVFATQRGDVADAAGPRDEDYRSAIPPLLLTLSSLGLVEEHVLQRLTCPRGPFLTSSNIFRYEAGDLLLLLVAFHRFGLHHDHCFKATVKALRRMALQKPLKSFLRRVLARDGDAALPTGGIPRCIHGLTLNLILEAAAAMAQSLHREKEVVELLAAIVAAAVHEEEEEETRANIKTAHASPQWRDACERDPRVLRTLQVHRAAKSFEQMELMQPILAHLLHRLSIRHGGLVVQGAGDSLNPERLGFYDAITADLVKVTRA